MRKTLLRRLLLVAVIIALAIAFFAFDIGQYLTLDYLKAQKQQLAGVYDRHGAMTIAIYAAVYITVTALSLPGAAVMTLAGGAIFGLVTGTITVSFASTIGATLAFLVSRFLLRDYVQNRFRDKLAAVNRGIEKDGSFYLFTLRLIPVFPFFIINLVMGLTPMRTMPYFFISQLGMLPATIVYVNAGSQLARIESAADILSPGLLLSFVLLGIFPLISKKILAAFQYRKVLRPFRKPKHFDYNLVVIGAGSAGLVAAYIAAAVRAKVALIEKQRMGGDCLNTGCVPSKALLRSARLLADAGRATEFGFREARVDFDFGEVMERVQRVIEKVAPHDSRERYSALGVDVIEGEAFIRSPYEVEVDRQKLTTRNIIIATGAHPVVPTLPGIENVEYVTSDTIWALRRRPQQFAVLGGGPIGCELAQAFARLGCDVTLIERGPHILSREDREISDIIAGRLTGEGIRILTGHNALRFEHHDGQQTLICEHDGHVVHIGFDTILLALGRKASTDIPAADNLDIGLAANGTIAADDFLRTRYPNIYVCGDVAGPYQFTHTASHQAWYAAVNALFSPLKKFRVDYSVIPWATFTDPEIARVGLNELDAGKLGIAYEVTRYGIHDLDRAIADGEDHGLVKVLTVPGRDRILGATIVGSHASEYISEFVTAMKHGFGLNRILGTIHIYPTFSEANKHAAGVWKKAHQPEKLLAWVEKFHAWRRKAGQR